jgi:hypothetical protein
MEAAVDWRAKVELFEQMRRDYEHGEGTIRGVARKFGVHRRMVREALASSLPAKRKPAERACPKLGAVKDFIDAILSRFQWNSRQALSVVQRELECLFESIRLLLVQFVWVLRVMQHDLIGIPSPPDLK